MTVVYRFEGHLVALAQHHRRQIAVQVIEVGQKQKRVAPENLEAAACVAGLVLESGGDEDLAIAGLLHDAVEDAKGMTGEQMSDLIRSEFGDRVADIVEGCSDAKSSPGGNKPPWKSRKEAYIKHLRSASDDVLRVSIADKVHNARSIATDQDRFGAELWKRFSSSSEESRWYYTSLRDVYKERISDSYLIKELDIAIARIWPD